MSDSMLLADREGRMYDPDVVVQILSEIPGIANLKTGKGDQRLTRTIEADYTFRGETTHVTLLPKSTEPIEYTALRIDGFGVAGFTLALEFNARHAEVYGKCLDVFTQSYSFHQRLEKDMTVESLRNSIKSQPFAGAPADLRDRLSGNQGTSSQEI